MCALIIEEAMIKLIMTNGSKISLAILGLLKEVSDFVKMALILTDEKET